MAACLSFEQMLLQASVLLSEGTLGLRGLIHREWTSEWQSEQHPGRAQRQHRQRLVRLLRLAWDEAKETREGACHHHSGIQSACHLLHAMRQEDEHDRGGKEYSPFCFSKDDETGSDLWTCLGVDRKCASSRRGRAQCAEGNPPCEEGGRFLRVGGVECR